MNFILAPSTTRALNTNSNRLLFLSVRDCDVLHKVGQDLRISHALNFCSADDEHAILL